MPRKTRATLRGPQSGSQRPTGGYTQLSLDDAPPREPQGAVLGSTRDAATKSCAAVGLDTSMTAVTAVCLGYDAKTDKIVGPTWGEVRWTPEVDYFVRLGQAAKTHDLVLDLLRELWVVDPSRVWVAMEEPFPMGMLGGRSANFQASYAKQQAEVSGAVKGSLVRYGFPNLIEINNSQWKKTLRQEGVEFAAVPRGSSQSAKAKIQLANKMRVKEWAVGSLGMPELPDLVKSRSGAKILRPESGFGANAQAVQAHDAYDAAAVMAWCWDYLEQEGVFAK